MEVSTQSFRPATQLSSIDSPTPEVRGSDELHTSGIFEWPSSLTSQALSPIFDLVTLLNSNPATYLSGLLFICRVRL